MKPTQSMGEHTEFGEPQMNKIKRSSVALLATTSVLLAAGISLVAQVEIADAQSGSSH